MRALVVRPGPQFSVADVANGWVKGLRACGVDVVDFNFDDRLNFYATHEAVESTQDAARLAAQGLAAACYSWWPDLVLVVSGFFLPPEVYGLLRSRRHKVVLLHTESPYEDDVQVMRAEHADLNLVNDPVNLDRFPPGTFYVPHGYDPDIHKPRPADPALASDFCFVGTGFPSRVEFFDRVDWSGLDVTFAGNWRHTSPESPLRGFLAHDIDECCPNDQAARLYASTKVSANLYRKEASHNADGWAMGPREVELAACGTFFIRERRGEGDELFPMLPLVTCPDEFGDQVRWWAAHDDLRAEAAGKARAAVADRTFEALARRLLARL